jgi:hypothetical protein
MNNGYLSQYFETVAAKKLSAVEVDPEKSHQHEFNGSKELKQVLGFEQPQQLETKFLWIEEQNAALSEEGTVTWYDARENHPTRSEYRLYFPSNGVMNMASEGDTLFIAKRTDGSLMIVITLSGSTIESQLYWLFGLSPLEGKGFEVAEIDRSKDHELDFAARFILDELGIEIEEPENDKLDRLLARFYGRFPNTADFSKFARDTSEFKINLAEDPDLALIEYMNWEEKLFRRLERHVVSQRLEEGFVADDGHDVDGFINFSLSVQNRRKSRAGYAFEDHLTNILLANGIAFTRKAETEFKSKPDFLFPGILEYRNALFPHEKLTVLGTKTSCKDRWRQVLSEAEKIKNKHLLTLEPGISENQTTEMRGNRVQLIVPESLHQTYTASQRTWLMNVKEFIDLVKERQGSFSNSFGRLF